MYITMYLAVCIADLAVADQRTLLFSIVRHACTTCVHACVCACVRECMHCRSNLYNVVCIVSFRAKPLAPLMYGGRV